MKMAYHSNATWYFMNINNNRHTARQKNDFLSGYQSMLYIDVIIDSIIYAYYACVIIRMVLWLGYWTEEPLLRYLLLRPGIWRFRVEGLGIPLRGH